MRNIRFAVVAMVVAVVAMGCKKSDIDKVILSVTEVTENSISGRCAYTPDGKNDGGYLIFLCRTDEVTDELRQFMTEAYDKYQPCHENKLFTFDSLAFDRTYYIKAVTYSNKNGKVAIDNIVTLAQRTLASNDSRVTYEKTSIYMTLDMVIDDNGYYVELYDVADTRFCWYDLHVALKEPTVVDTIEGTNCYQDGKIVFTFSYTVSLPSIYDYMEKQQLFYAYAPTEIENQYKKYEIEVTICCNRGTYSSRTAEVD